MNGNEDKTQARNTIVRGKFTVKRSHLMPYVNDIISR